MIEFDDFEGAARVTTPLRTAWEIGTQESLAAAVALLVAMVRAGHVDGGSLARLAHGARADGGRGASRRSCHSSTGASPASS